MKEEILQKLKDVLAEGSLNEIIQSEEFYFQKAINKYNEFMALPKLGEEKTKEVLDRINSHKEGNSFSHMELIEEYKSETDVHDILEKLAELIAYIDSHAANKNELNKYEDSRTIARAGVRQNAWVINLLNYKQSENIDNLSGGVKNAIRYLLNPSGVLNILSERHRKLIGMFIFQNSSISLDFDEVVIKELSALNIDVKNEKNRAYVYERILYSDNIKQIWNHNQTIWKMSHGYKSFNREERERYLNEKIITIEENTGLKQGKNFVSEMKIGDLFYLCFSSKEIKLLGIITSDASDLTDNPDKIGWVKRSYEIIKECNNTEAYKGTNMGWSPNHNSTFMTVKEEHLTIFEKELLLPYFDMHLEDLLNIDKSEYPSSKVKIDNEGSSNAEPDDNDSSNDDPSNISLNRYGNLNYIIYGPPGTGKTYNTVNYAVAMVENKEAETLQVEDYKSVKNRFEQLKNDKQIAFITFHQSFGYEEFIEGIKPEINKASANEESNTHEISYSLSDGVFKRFCSEALKHKNKNYVFIIDEINRGNISKIFGELITLIERSKRIGREEETSAVLPYSGDFFGVPQNVFILGTMNTADRSIALLDTALRRRFEFIEMMPDTDVFRMLNDNNELIVAGINIKHMLDMINKRIEILYDREHTIGQAYFIDLIRDSSIENLSSIFVHKVIPLLQEYFYDDYEKLRMILSDNQTDNTYLQFINVDDIPKNIFGKNSDSEILEDKKIYSINKDALSNPEAYIKIYDVKAEALQNE